jgi:hypothetical protein
MRRLFSLPITVFAGMIPAVRFAGASVKRSPYFPPAGRFFGMSRLISAVLACAAGLAYASSAHAKVTFDFNYSLDSGFFTTNPAAKTALERAATVYSDRLVDTLTDITPGNGNTWNANFSNPSTGAATQITDLTIPTGSIKVYVGGATLGGALGQGGPGGFTGNGDSVFVSNLLYRGQTGAADNPPSDFARWGGTIAFDKTVAWNFNLTAPAAGKNDFLTVATHELAHVLGFGTSDAWRAKLTAVSLATGGTQYVGPFTGPKAMQLNNNTPVPLETPAGTNNAQHFKNSLMSTVGGLTAQETLMDPDITTGTRKKITLLDWAALDDIGWDLAKGGDANADGSVDFLDLAKMAQNYNVTDGQRRWSDGDFNYDGNVDFQDLSIMAQSYNTSGVQGGPAVPAGTSSDFAADWAAAVASVPEPSALVVVGLLLTCALKRHRRRPASTTCAR